MKIIEYITIKPIIKYGIEMGSSGNSNGKNRRLCTGHRKEASVYIEGEILHTNVLLKTRTTVTNFP